MSSIRCIVVTGAGTGVGEALCMAFAADGIVLGLIGRNQEKLDNCAARCRAAGAVVQTGYIDIRDSTAMRSWLLDFDRANPIDLIIANAGIASTVASLSDWEDLERIKAVMETNYTGTLNTVLPVVERMKTRGSGHVAIISSLAALHGMAISPAYCASKAALLAYGESVRPLLAKQGIHVSIVLPGFIKTTMSAQFPGDKFFLWSSDKAALLIKQKLLARRSVIAFPLPLLVGLKLLCFVPASIADRILASFSYEPPSTP